jgi:tRNA (guanine37-N1)-methyltransferase
VPDVLMSGHHEKIRAWRKLQAERTTESRRPDLWAAYQKRMAQMSAGQNQKKGRAS